MSPKTVEVIVFPEHPQNTPVNASVSFETLDKACLDELTHHIDEYISTYYTPTWDASSEIHHILNECRLAFYEFLDYAFDCNQPEIFIEVYLHAPIVFSDQTRCDISRIVMQGLNKCVSPGDTVSNLLINYAHAWALYNMSYFISSIAIKCGAEISSVLLNQEYCVD